MYDFLCVGCGFFNATFARIAADHGKSVLIIDKNEFIGGHSATYKNQGVLIHKFGPHILNTNNREVWNFLKNFDQINHYKYNPKALHNNKLYSFPINLLTLSELGMDNVEPVSITNPANFEEFVLSQVGVKIYEVFYKEYTKKQWGIEPKHLPASIAKRIPIRLNLNDDYHDKIYHGIPQNGYTHLITNMIQDQKITLELGVNYFEQKDYWNSLAKRVVYTGKIDEYFNYCYGELEYRTLHIQHREENYDTGCIAIHYTDDSVEYTRRVNHNYWLHETKKANMYHYSTEIPMLAARSDDPYYPMRGIHGNDSLYDKYYYLTELEKEVYFKGRLGSYRYTDMCPTVEEAIKFAKELCK